MKVVLLLIASCMVATCGMGRTVGSVAEAIKLAEGGFRGEVEITGIYDFHSEEDTLYDGSENDGLLILVLMPMLKDVPQAQRYAARERLGKRYHAKRVIVSGEMKKGRIDGLSRDIIYVSVSTIKEVANQPTVPRSPRLGGS